MRLGFSILEVLAATVVLGLLAVSVVPLTSRLVNDDGHLQNRVVAGELLQHIELQSVPRSGLASPLDDHPGWWVRADRLTPLVPPTQPGQPEASPTYGWVRLVIIDGPGANAQIIAERMLVITGGDP